VLHLTRPGVEIPDREALGLGSHLDAARGAYILRDYRPGAPQHGCVFVQGTMNTANLLQALPEVDAAGLNLKFVAAPAATSSCCRTRSIRTRWSPRPTASTAPT
jgi:transketolase